MKIKILILFFLLFPFLSKGIDYYAYQSGFWDVSTTWTQDPSGTTLVGMGVPGVADNVTILNARTVFVTTAKSCTNLIINLGGMVDIGTTGGCNFGNVSGEGTFRTQTLAIPGGVYTAFVAAGGGTFEYYNVSGNLPITQTTYNHLKLTKTDNNATNYNMGLISNLTLNGSLTVEREAGTGVLSFNIGNSNAARAITILGNLNCFEGTIIRVGNFNQLHTLALTGNLTCSGTIDFTNNVDYANNTLGALRLTLTGTNDCDVNINQNTTFYQFIVDKGVDQTYVVYVKSSAFVDPFKGDNGSNTITLTNGTLNLGENIRVNRLRNAASNYDIVASSCLWIDDATVTDPLCFAVVVYGTFRVSGGSYYINSAGGTFVTRVTGAIWIEGGYTGLKQFRPSNTDPNHNGSFTITGGVFDVLGPPNMNDFPTFAWPYSTSAFMMTGGTINVHLPTTGGVAVNGGILIGCDVSNINVTGGTLNVYIPASGVNFNINSTAPFGNVNIYKEGAGAAQAVLGVQNFNRPTLGNIAMPGQPLVVLNDLNLITGNIFTFNANGFDVKVGGNFTIQPNTTYTPGNNTTTFNGTANQLFDNYGTIFGNLYNMTIDKTTGTLSTGGSATSFTIRNNFDLLDGTFNDNGKTINVGGTLTNSDTHIGSGKIVLNGTVFQTVGGDGNGVFQNFEINNTYASNSVNQTANMVINGDMIFTSTKVYNIQNFKLTLGVNSKLVRNGIGKYIASDGNVGDAGVTKIYSAAQDIYTFAIGVGPGRYTPAVIDIVGSATSYGSISVVPVDMEQPNTSENGKSRSLTYFYRVKSSGFVLGAATVNHKYFYNQADVYTPIGNVTEPGYVAARYNPLTYTWTKWTTADVDETANTIGGSGTNLASLPYIDGDYTAGDDVPGANDPFSTILVYYSYLNGGDYTNKDSWSITGHAGPQDAPNKPGIQNPVIIGNGHTIVMNSNNEFAGSIQIEKGATLDMQAATGCNFSIALQHPNGNGTLRISGTNAQFPGGDFSEFLGVNGGTVDYYSPAGTNLIMPLTSFTGDLLGNYYNLTLSPANTRNVIMPDRNILVYNNMLVNGTTATSTAKFNVGSSKTLTVNNQLTVASGVLQYSAPNAQTVNVLGDVSVSANAVFNVNGTLGVNNTLNLYKSLINNGIVDFRNRAVCNVNFIGEDDASITGTTATLTEFNKLKLDKGNDQTKTLTLDVLGTLMSPNDSWLTLSNGTFRFVKASDISVTTISTFNIPVSACFYVNNPSAVVYIAKAAVDNNDLILNGKMHLANGTFYVGNTNFPANNNDISYSSSGSATIIIESGNMYVNGQIRRPISATTGVLTYRQSGGNLLINGNNNQATRGKLEVCNAGSEFEMTGGTITLETGAGTTFDDIYLHPDIHNVTGGTIYLGNSLTTAAEIFRINATCPLWNVVVDATTNIKVGHITINPLKILNDLTILGNSRFICNGLNLNIGGTLTNNNSNSAIGVNVGGFQTGNINQITTFDGTQASQSIVGIVGNSVNFANLVINNTHAVGSVALGTNTVIYVNNNLTLTDGLLYDNGNIITSYGNIANFSEHKSKDTGCLYLNDNTNQIISGDGNGVFGNVVLNNATNATFSAGQRINGILELRTGKLTIGEYLLTMGEDASVSGAFSSTKMIASNGAASDLGIIKYFYSGAPIDFTFPIGNLANYTPASFSTNGTNLTGTTPYIGTKAVNSEHPATTDAANDRALHYYWHLETGGGFTVTSFTQEYIYLDSDVFGAENQYVTAHLPFASQWIKEGSIDIANPALGGTLTFTNLTNINGDYTAGHTLEFGLIKTYHSIRNGDWNDINPATCPWLDENNLVPTAIPIGANMIINDNHKITVRDDQHFRNAYTLNMNGTNAILSLGVSYGHMFLYTYGVGKIQIHSTAFDFNNFPGGDFSLFTASGGGTFEYIGKGYLPAKSLYNNIQLTGEGGNIQIPATDLKLNGYLMINSQQLDNSNFNRDINIAGNWTDKTLNGFVAGTGRVVFDGFSPQILSANTLETFYDMQITNPAGLTLNTPLLVTDDLYLTSGIITTTATNLLTLSNTSNAAVIGGSMASYIDGPLSKRIGNLGNFVFPIGDAGRYGPTTISNTITAGAQFWKAEYLNHNPLNEAYDPDAMQTPLSYVSDREYWTVLGPVGGQSLVQLRWDASSVVPTDNSERQNNVEIAQWQADNKWHEIPSTVTDGGVTSGLIISNATVNYNTFAGGNIYTIGSTVSIETDFSWTGTINRQWSIAGNWGNGIVPTLAMDVTISSVPVNQPIIDVTNAVCNSLYINANAIVTIQSAKSLSVNGGIVNNGTFVIKSDNTGTGSLIASSMGASGGNISVERFLAGCGCLYNFHYVTTPFVSSNVNVFPANVYSFNESQGSYFMSYGWTRMFTGNIIAGKGYNVKSVNDATVTFTGNSLNINDVTVPITYTPTLATTTYEGWNLVGNPYPSSLDWDLVNTAAANVRNEIHFWNGASYSSYVQGVSINVGAGGNGRYIPPMQGFFLKAKTGGGTLTFPKSARIHVHGAFRGGFWKSEINHLIKFSVSSHFGSDEAAIRFSEVAEDNYDDYDAQKIGSNIENQPNIFSYSGDGNALCINTMQLFIDSKSVKLGTQLSSGIYTFNVSELNFPNNIQIWLEDFYKKIKVDLRKNQKYIFEAVPNSSHRFAIHFIDTSEIKYKATHVVANSEPSIHSFANRIYTILPNTYYLPATLEIFNVMGQKVETHHLTNIRSDFSTLIPGGIYFAKIVYPNSFMVKKILLE